MRAQHTQAAARRILHKAFSDITGAPLHAVAMSAACDPGDALPARQSLDPTYRGMTATPIPAVIRRSHVFILNLFCGARRPKDSQYSLEQSIQARNFPLPDVEIWVLAIDVVVDPVNGDLTRKRGRS